MKLCIADPPYPPGLHAGGRKNRASRWYGTGQRSALDVPADVHENASAWDNPARHARLLTELMDRFDAWAIATSADGIAAYGLLPVGVKLMAWVKPAAQPTSHRIASGWEVVITYPAVGRRSNRGVGMAPDVLVCPSPRGFRGSKPEAWTHWVLSALSYDSRQDHVTDMFPGSGMVTRAVKSWPS